MNRFGDAIEREYGLGEQIELKINAGGEFYSKISRKMRFNGSNAVDVLKFALQGSEDEEFVDYDT